MRRRLRKTIPFLLAIFSGVLAGALVAGGALLAAHPLRAHNAAQRAAAVSLTPPPAKPSPVSNP